jgi:hypothetical protein
MRFSRRQSKKSKAAGLFKTYLELKAVKRLAKLSPILGVAAAGAAFMRKRRSGGAQTA